MNIKKIKAILDHLSTRPNKKLGQNFLVNEKIAEDIVKKVKTYPAPWVEIGPGLGSLTEFLEEEKDQVFLIEKDKKLLSYWEQKGFRIFSADALKFNWEKLPKSFTLFGNLPYQIAGSLILETSSLNEKIFSMVFMMQKEVGERILARPSTKDYGLLSVMAQTFWIPKFLFSVGKRDFYPVPEVKGWVLEFKKQSSSVPPDLFLKFLKIAFAHRRKKLLTQLPKSFRKDWNIFFTNQGWSFDLRAEELAPSEFQSLYKEYMRLNDQEFARNPKIRQ